MTKSLGQIVRIENVVRKKDNEVGSDLKKQVQVSTLITGRTKTFRARDPENIAPEHVGRDEYQEVALTVEDALKETGGYSAAALNVIATKDRTNQAATADLEFRGAVLLRDVPISHLLFLEDYLTEWRTFLTVLPVLDPSKKWSEDEGRKGLYKSSVETVDRNIPDKVPVVLYPHTDKHPANVQLIDKAVHVGWFDNQVLSGAVPRDRKKALLDNCDDLLSEVKNSIALANKTDAIEETGEGPALMAALLA
jgi:hypothetical protein